MTYSSTGSRRIRPALDRGRRSRRRVVRTSPRASVAFGALRRRDDVGQGRCNSWSLSDLAVAGKPGLERGDLGLKLVDFRLQRPFVGLAQVKLTTIAHSLVDLPHHLARVLPRTRSRLAQR